LGLWDENNDLPLFNKIIETFKPGTKLKGEKNLAKIIVVGAMLKSIK